MFCRQCGKPIEESAEHCPFCGGHQYILTSQDTVDASKPRDHKKKSRTSLTILIALLIAAVGVAVIVVVAAILRNGSVNGIDRKIVNACIDRTRNFYRPETFRITDIEDIQYESDKDAYHMIAIHYMVESKGGSVVSGTFLLDYESEECVNYEDDWEPGSSWWERASEEEQKNAFRSMGSAGEHYYMFLAQLSWIGLTDSYKVESFERDRIKRINEVFKKEL